MRMALPWSRAQSSSVDRAAWGRRASVVAIALGAMTSGALSSGCAVSESDVHRWESTERGPYKLVAVITHDKYSWPLRTEAALSLIRMGPRGGRRMGISYLCDKYKDETELTDRDGALAEISEETRKKIVDGMVKPMIDAMQKPPPPKKPDGTMPADPSIPYKDAAYAMLSHEPTLVSDPKSKDDLVAALNQWVQADFEHRIEDNSQQYGVEQIMRFLGAPSVRALPGLFSESSNQIDKIAALVADLGDADTKQKASEMLVTLAKRIDSQGWYDTHKPLVADSDAKSGAKVTPQQLDTQVKQWQDQALTQVFASMKRMGGRPVVDYCLAYGADARTAQDRRAAALAALEGRIDKSNAPDIDKLFVIAKDDNAPDPVRDLAFARLGELPKELIVNRLYTFFDSKKWKVRWSAASLILKTMSVKDVPDFMRHLPSSPATKMGMSEFTQYGSIILSKDTPAGGPKPRDLINGYLGAHDMSSKMTALGAYYGGAKSDLSKILPLEGDPSPVPKCDKDDDCGWSCDVPKSPGSQDTDTKVIATVGDFAKYCVAPSLVGK